MTCIKNGIYVSIPAYGYYAPADLYEVGDTYVVRFNGDLERFASFTQLRHPTHVLHVFGDQDFWRPDLGIAVVEKRYLREIQNDV